MIAIFSSSVISCLQDSMPARPWVYPMGSTVSDAMWANAGCFGDSTQAARRIRVRLERPWCRLRAVPQSEPDERARCRRERNEHKLEPCDQMAGCQALRPVAKVSALRSPNVWDAA